MGANFDKIEMGANFDKIEKERWELFREPEVAIALVEGLKKFKDFERLFESFKTHEEQIMFLNLCHQIHAHAFIAGQDGE